MFREFSTVSFSFKVILVDFCALPIVWTDVYNSPVVKLSSSQFLLIYELFFNYSQIKSQPLFQVVIGNCLTI